MRFLWLPNWTACGLPFDVVAVVLNVTAVDPTGPGFLSLYPAAIEAPVTSTVNFTAHKGRPFSTASVFDAQAR